MSCRILFTMRRAIMISLAPLFFSAIVGASEGERRYILDESFAWISQEGAKQLVQNVKSAGFNIIVPCVWHGRGVTWSSSYGVKEPLWANRNPRVQDPLAFLISEAHEAGLEVHPWFTISLRPIEILSEFYQPGTPPKSFDIHNKDFRSFMLERIEEVVNNYDIDGLNLDYVRSMGICVSDSCAESYKAETGKSINTDRLLKEIDKDAFSRIASWNAGAVEPIVFGASEILARKNSRLPLSVSSHAGLDVLREQGTDSLLWANRGWVDIILHIDYESEKKIRYHLIEKALTTLDDPKKFVLMVGNYEGNYTRDEQIVPRNAKRVAELIELSRSIQSDNRGVALYQYAYLSPAQIAALRTGPFKNASSKQLQTKLQPE